MDKAKILAAGEWFGFGRWDAPYWFVGMEPERGDRTELYAAWEAAGGGELVDAKKHEDEWNTRAPDGLKTQFFADRPATEHSWHPMIYILMGFTGRLEDPHRFQRDQVGRTDGSVALINLYAIPAPDTVAREQRLKHEQDRMKTMREHIENADRKLVIFYGTSSKVQFAELAGGPFDMDGFRWNGHTLFANIPHPARFNKGTPYWEALGEKMREFTLKQK